MVDSSGTILNHLYEQLNDFYQQLCSLDVVGQLRLPQ